MGGNIAADRMGSRTCYSFGVGTRSSVMLHICSGLDATRDGIERPVMLDLNDTFSFSGTVRGPRLTARDPKRACSHPTPCSASWQSRDSTAPTARSTRRRAQAMRASRAVPPAPQARSPSSSRCPAARPCASVAPPTPASRRRCAAEGAASAVARLAPPPPHTAPRPYRAPRASLGGASRGPATARATSTLSRGPTSLASPRPRTSTSRATRPPASRPRTRSSLRERAGREERVAMRRGHTLLVPPPPLQLRGAPRRRRRLRRGLPVLFAPRAAHLDHEPRQQRRPGKQGGRRRSTPCLSHASAAPSPAVAAGTSAQAFQLVFEYAQACATNMSRLAAVQVRPCIGRWGGGACGRA